MRTAKYYTAIENPDHSLNQYCATVTISLKGVSGDKLQLGPALGILVHKCITINARVRRWAIRHLLN